MRYVLHLQTHMLCWHEEAGGHLPAMCIHHISSKVDLNQGCRRGGSGYFTTVVIFSLYSGSFQCIHSFRTTLLQGSATFTSDTLDFPNRIGKKLLQWQSLTPTPWRLKKKGKLMWRWHSWGKRMALFIPGLGKKPTFYKNRNVNQLSHVIQS